MDVKGTAVASVPKFIEEKFGAEGLNKWLGAINPNAKTVYSQPILASKWYPLNEILIEPTHQLCNSFYGGSLKGAWEAGRFSASYGLTGILKIFVRMGTPGFIVSRATSILPSYYQPSEIKVTDSSNSGCTVQITKFPEPSPIIENRIGGWIERALEIQGCKSVEVKITKSVANHDEVCEYTINWK